MKRSDRIYCLSGLVYWDFQCRINESALKEKIERYFKIVFHMARQISRSGRRAIMKSQC